EEVDRLDDRDVVGNAIDGRIVGLVQTDEDVRVAQARQSAQDLLQILQSELGSSTRAGHHLREPLFDFRSRHSLDLRRFRASSSSSVALLSSARWFPAPGCAPGRPRWPDPPPGPASRLRAPAGSLRYPRSPAPLPPGTCSP